MNRRFEDLVNEAACDGAFTPMGSRAHATDEDVEQLLGAWYDERSHRVEGLLLLGESAQLIHRVLTQANLPPRTRKRLCRLLKEIRRHQLEAG